MEFHASEEAIAWRQAVMEDLWAVLGPTRRRIQWAPVLKDCALKVCGCFDRPVVLFYFEQPAHKRLPSRGFRCFGEIAMSTPENRTEGLMLLAENAVQQFAI